jgi:hypothetical protein
MVIGRGGVTLTFVFVQDVLTDNDPPPNGRDSCGENENARTGKNENNVLT